MERRTLRRAGLAAVVLGTVLAHGAEASAAGLSVCVDKTSPAAPMQRALAENVAAAQHATLSVHEFDGGGDGDDPMKPAEFKRLADTECQLVLGFPMDASGGDLPDGVQATRPYGQTGFALVLPSAGAARSLKQLPAGTHVGITFQTVPNLYLAEIPSLLPDIEQTEADTLHALSSGHVQAAMIWQPDVVQFLARSPDRARYAVVPLDERHARWNLVALYAPTQAQAAAAFEHSVATLGADGTLAPIFAPYGVDVTLGAADPVKKAEASPPVGARVWLAAVQTGTNGSLPTLYTTGQADDGASEFSANCAQCHGENLEGGAGPSLVGPNFANARAAFKVRDVFAVISQNMPAGAPGTLEHDEYVKIMAFLLQKNGYPSGGTALTFEAASASEAAFQYQGGSGPAPKDAAASSQAHTAQ